MARSRQPRVWGRALGTLLPTDASGHQFLGLLSRTHLPSWRWPVGRLATSVRVRRVATGQRGGGCLLGAWA
eukprot:5495781-Pyramimonas_sp.AAC.1